MAKNKLTLSTVACMQLRVDGLRTISAIDNHSMASALQLGLARADYMEISINHNGRGNAIHISTCGCRPLSGRLCLWKHDDGPACPGTDVFRECGLFHVNAIRRRSDGKSLIAWGGVSIKSIRLPLIRHQLTAPKDRL